MPDIETPPLAQVPEGPAPSGDVPEVVPPIVVPEESAVSIDFPEEVPVTLPSSFLDKCFWSASHNAAANSKGGEFGHVRLILLFLAAS